MDAEKLSRKIAEGLDSLKKQNFCDRQYKVPKRNFLF